MEAREPVLVVLCPDGGVEVYAGAKVNVSVRQLTDMGEGCKPSDWTDAEEYLWTTLPKGHRHLYRIKHLQVQGRPEKITPPEVKRHAVDLELLRLIREWGEELRA